jgi:hypothetical protein
MLKRSSIVGSQVSLAKKRISIQPEDKQHKRDVRNPAPWPRNKIIPGSFGPNFLPVARVYRLIDETSGVLCVVVVKQYFSAKRLGVDDIVLVENRDPSEYRRAKCT